MNKEQIKQLATLHKNVLAIADQVSKAEAEIVIAEEQLKRAETDDGKTPPGELFDRTEAAKRDLGIRKIEANRAAAKLSEAEEALCSAARSSHALIDSALQKKSSQIVEDMRGKIIEITGPLDAVPAGDIQLTGLLSKSPKVIKIHAACNLMASAAAMGSEMDLAKAVISAAELI